MKKIHEFGKWWLPIPEFDGYFSSEDGEILSLAKSRNKPRKLKQISSEDGHKYVFVYRNGQMSKMFVHRAVLMAWDRMPEPGEEARHLNDVPSENTLKNLSWGSRQENVDDKRRNGGIPVGERSGSHKLTEEQVMEIRHRYADGEPSIELAKEFGVSRNTILVIFRGEKWKHLPLVPAKVAHPSRRKTPIGRREIDAGTAALTRAAASRRKKRELIPCACGCGQMIMSVDSYGRDRKYVQGHNQKGKNWRWSKNDKDKN